MARKIVENQYATSTSALTEPLSRSVASPLFGGNILAVDYNFAEKKILDDDITFSRASGATQNGSDGYIKYADANLQNSSEFYNAATSWGSDNVTVTNNNFASPNGDLTSMKVLCENTTERHEIYAFFGANVQNTIYEHSYYVKPFGSCDAVLLSLTGAANTGVLFDIVNGVEVENNLGGINLGTNITALNDGWFRVSFTMKSPSSASLTSVYIAIGSVASKVSGSAVLGNFAAGTGDGIYLWGAQSAPVFKHGTTQVPYNKTSGSNFHAPRFDYDKDGNSKGLLIEEVRTNLFKHTDLSNSSSDGWDWLISGSGTTLANATTDPTGGNNAVKLIANTNNTLKLFGVSSVPTASSGTTVTASLYVKNAGGRYVIFYLNDSSSRMLRVDLQTGQITSNTADSGTIEALANDWYRISFTRTLDANLGSVFISPSLNGQDVSFAGDGSNGIFVWGAQFEQGSFPTSLIPTYGSSASRSGDLTSVTGLAFSRFFKDTQGTFAIDVQMPKGWQGKDNALFGFPYFFIASNGTSSQRITLYGRPNQKYISGHIQSGSEVDLNLSTNSTIDLSSGEISRHAMAYKEDDGRYSGDGDVFTVTDTSVTVPVGVDRLHIGNHWTGSFQINGWFRRLRYFNKRKNNPSIKKITDTSFLLDKFKGAKAAHSLRSLRDGRDNSAVTRIRREYDSFEADYTAAQVTNGELENDFKAEAQTTLPLDVSVEADEMVTNGTFDSATTGWTAGGGATLAVDNARLKITNDSDGNSYAYQALSTQAGRQYNVSLDYTDDTGTNALLWMGTSAGGNQLGAKTFTTTGHYTLTFTATSSISYIRVGANEPSNGTIYLFDNVSVKEVNPIGTGFSTRKINSSYTGKAMRCRNQGNVEVECGFDSNNEISLSSPVTNTSQNLLAFSENFGEWTFHSTHTPIFQKGIADPFGASNAGLLTAAGSNNGSQIKNDNLSLTSGTYYTVSLYIKKGTSTKTRLGIYKSGWIFWTETTFDASGVPSSTGNLNSTNISYEKIGDDGWYRFSFVGKATTTASNHSLIFYPDRNATNKNAFIHAAQLEETQYESTPSGSELVTNGTFDTDSDWVKGTGWTIDSGDSNKASCDGSQTTWSILRQNDKLPASGSKVVASFDITDYAAGILYVRAGATAVATQISANGSYSITLPVVYSSSGDNQFRFQADLNFVGAVDNVSVKELSPELQTYAQTPVISNDGSNTTATTLGEFSGLENLLDYSEDFSNNFWSKIDCTAVSSNVADPFGGTGAYKITETGTNAHLVKTSVATTGQVKSIYARTVSGTGVVDVLGANGPKYKVTLTEEWQRFDSVVDTSEGGGNHVYGVDFRNSNTTLTEVLLFGAQVNTNSLKTYQKTTGTALTGDVNVVNWYDQAGGEDFTQSTAAYQPRIVMGSELVTDSGGKASVYFDGGDVLRNDSLAGQNRLDSYYSVDTDDDAYVYPAQPTGSSAYGIFADDGGSNSTLSVNYGSPTIYNNGSVLTGTQNAIHDALKGHHVVSHIEASTASFGSFGMGWYSTGSTTYNFTGKISEMVFFPNMDSSPKRFPIEQNMLRHFDVNLVANGTFDTDSGWTKGTGVTISNGKANFSNAPFVALFQNIGQQTGKVKVTFDVTDYTSGTLNAYSGGNQSAGSPINVTATAIGSYTAIVDRAGGNNNIIFGSTNNFTGSIDNVKVQEYGTSGFINTLYDQTGNSCHALQATAANQPQIVSGGDLIKSGNRPAWEYKNNNPYHVLHLHGKIQAARLDAWFVHDTSDPTFIYPANYLDGNDFGWVAQDGSSSTSTSGDYGGGDSKLYANGTLVGASGSITRDAIHSALNGRKLVHHQDADTADWSKLTMGWYGNGAAVSSHITYGFTGKFSEWIWYDSDQSSNKTNIESNINTHYNIY